MSILFSEKFEDTLKRAQLGYTPQRYAKLTLISGIVGSVFMTAFFALMLMRQRLSQDSLIQILLMVFFLSFVIFFLLVKLIPSMTVNTRKAMLESDLLYSARHLLLKLQSGSSLLNSLESVSELNTKSSIYFKEIMFDISVGMPLEDALQKAIDYSPSAAFTKLLIEIMSSLKTGADIQKTLKATLDDVTKQHLILIEEYGKKLNPMSMFYMIIGTIVPSLGTAMLVVASSLMPGAIIIDIRVLMFIAAIVLIVQVFFLLAYRSLKPAVME
jgi:pilus assembly protein TadC